MIDYEDLAFEPTLTIEGLKEWLKDNAKKTSKNGFKFKSEYSTILNIRFLGDIALILKDKEVVFAGNPAQVKRVLEAMLNG